jgi:hypothetical protein
MTDRAMIPDLPHNTEPMLQVRKEVVVTQTA